MKSDLFGDKDKINLLEALYEKYVADASAFLDARGMYTPGFVFGCGDVSSKILLIGEAPGRDEVEKGMPFAGKAGTILDDFIKLTGFERNELFITNTVKYRLSRPRSGAAPSLIPVYDNKQLSNRPASSGEIMFSAEYLKEEIEILKPKIVVTLGNTPLKAVYACFFKGEKAPKVGDCRGKPIVIPETDDSYFLPVFHPASLIYNPGLKPLYCEDLSNIRRIFKL